MDLVACLSFSLLFFLLRFYSQISGISEPRVGKLITNPYTSVFFVGNIVKTSVPKKTGGSDKLLKNITSSGIPTELRMGGMHCLSETHNLEVYI